jgi:hypothetical protein
MLTQRQDLARHRAPGRNCLNRFAVPSPSDPDAHLGVPLRYIQPCTAGMNHFHGPSLPSHPDACGVRRGENREIQKSDARARWHQSTVPVEALRHHADLQAHRHHRADRDRTRRTRPVSALTSTANKSNQHPIFAHHGAPPRRRQAADLRSTRALHVSSHQIACFGYLIAFLVASTTEATWVLLPNRELFQRRLFSCPCLDVMPRDNQNCKNQAYNWRQGEQRSLIGTNRLSTIAPGLRLQSEQFATPMPRLPCKVLIREEFSIER